MYDNDAKLFCDCFLPAKLNEMKAGLDQSQARNLEQIGSELKQSIMMKENSPDHALMKLYLSLYLMKEGYKTVSVEHPFEYKDSTLRCDVKASGYEDLSIEVESRHAEHKTAKEIRKAGLYSRKSDKFAFCIPSGYKLYLPGEFFKPPEERDIERMKKHKKRCDDYCRGHDKVFAPNLEELLQATVDYVFIIDLVQETVVKKDAEDYIQTSLTNIKNPVI